MDQQCSQNDYIGYDLSIRFVSLYNLIVWTEYLGLRFRFQLLRHIHELEVVLL